MKSFRWPVFLLVLVALVIFPTPADAADGECVWRCENTIDTSTCKRSLRERFGGARDCDIESICTIVVIDPDGPGPTDPAVLIECRYNCRLDYCIWA